MATPLDPKQVVTFEELLMSQVVYQDVLVSVLIKKWKGRPRLRRDIITGPQGVAHNKANHPTPAFGPSLCRTQ